MITLALMAYLVAVVRYLLHRMRSKRWDAFHSPYLYQVFTHCCQPAPHGGIFTTIEEARKTYKSSGDIVPRLDFGAGSLHDQDRPFTRIAHIAQHALSLPFQCRFLARLVEMTQARQVVEFGTSLGITASYISILSPGTSLVTVEGDPEIAKRAIALFAALRLDQITLVQASFQDFINHSLKDLPPLDVVFLDGDHREESLLINYTALAEKCHEGTVMMIDDIHWSNGMYSGWRKLVQRPEVTQSVDCYHFGLLFFRSDFMGKEHHIVRLPWESLWK